MSFAKNEYTGNGSNTDFAVSFEYIDQSHVSVTVDGVDAPFTWVSAGMIRISPAPAGGTFIRIRRETSQDERLTTYFVPSALTEEDLNNDSKQAFFMAQEAIDRATESFGQDVDGQWDAQSKRVKNIADGVNPQDAITKAQLDAAVLAPVSPLAVNITNVPSGNLASANVQDALNELQGDVNTINAALTANASAGVGRMFFVPGSAAPTGALKVNGALLSRTTYAALWAYAQASGNITASDADWTTFSSFGKFSPGDGSTTFRIPDLRGYHLRAFDDGRGVDTARTLGTVQGDDNKSHTHTGSTSTDGNHTHTMSARDQIGSTSNTPLAIDAQRLATITTDAAGNHNHTFTTAASGGTETRVKNIALLACIQY